MTLGQKIVEDAFADYGRWLTKWADDLEEVGVVERPTVYMYMLEGIDIDTAKIMAVVETK